RPRQVAVAVGGHVLPRRRHALEAGARIDRRPGQRMQRTVRLLPLELHEDEVPELHPGVAAELLRLVEREEAVGVLVDPRLHRLRPTVQMDLAARAAGTGGTHRPEVVLLAE